MLTGSNGAAAAYVANTLAPLVNYFRTLQDPTGRVAGYPLSAMELLDALRVPVRHIYRLTGQGDRCADAFEASVDRWQGHDLTTPPQFDEAVAAYHPPDPGSLTFFIAPLMATNGPAPSGSFLECFLAYREEPDELEELAARMPRLNQAGQSFRFLAGSTGFSHGNCLVFFPQDVVTATPVMSPSFACFFMNKFYRIYQEQTLPQVRRLLGDRGWASAQLSPAECYQARCISAYAHDYFHHRGPRPLDAHLAVKLEFFAGLLEELKVDCQTAGVAYHGDLPFGRAIVEFILFERLFRYPGQPDATRNFDAGSGIFLFQWLLKSGSGIHVHNDRLTLDVAGCVAGMAELAAQIEAMEISAADDRSYLAQAEQFVRALLPEAVGEARFAMPADFQRLTGIRSEEFPLLTFLELPY